MNSSAHFRYMRPSLPRLKYFQDRWLPPLYWLLALILSALCWWSMGELHSRLWSRLPENALTRYALDLTETTLPAKPNERLLFPLCEGRWSRSEQFLADWNSSARRRLLAACLAEAQGALEATQLRATVQNYQSLLLEQAKQAENLLASWRNNADASEKRLSAIRHSPRQDWPVTLPKGWEIEAPTAGQVTKATETQDYADYAPRHTEAAWEKIITQSRTLATEALQTEGLWVQARRLGLQLAGKRVSHAFADGNLSPVLLTERESLTEWLEWQRRGAQLAGTHERTERLPEIVKAVLTGATLAWVLAGLLGFNPLLWCAVSGLVSLGALTLLDVSLTADPALRLIVLRQYADLAGFAGIADIPLDALNGLLQGALTLPLHWPIWWVMPAFIGAVAMLRIPPLARRLTALSTHWVMLAHTNKGALIQGLFFILLALPVVLLGRMSAATSEFLIAIGALALASYAACHATLANVRPDWQWQSTTTVLLGISAAVVGSGLRGDLGHAVIALALGYTFFMMFANRWVALLLLIPLGGLLISLYGYAHGASWADRLAYALHYAPEHVQERFEAMRQPFEATTSDLARVRWLIVSGEASGWGMGWVPWQGLPQLGEQQAGLPLQGTSDYVAALYFSLLGYNYGGAALLTQLVLFIGCGFWGLTHSLRASLSLPQRLLAAWGGFGCLSVGLRALLSICGCMGLLPLTGIPVALLGYAPSTLFASLLYLIMLSASWRYPSSALRDTQDRIELVEQGPVKNQWLALSRTPLLLILVVGLLIGVTWAVKQNLTEWQSASPSKQHSDQHWAKRRFTIMQALASSLVTDSPALPNSAQCPNWAPLLEAWTTLFNTLAEKRGVKTTYALDGKRLFDTLSAQSLAQDCDKATQLLSRAYNEDRGLWRSLPWRDSMPAYLYGQSKDIVQLKARDFMTANPWWGLPGRTLMNGETAESLAAGRNTSRGQAFSEGVEQVLDESPLLAAQLRFRLSLINHTASATPGSTLFHGKKLRRGENATLTLEPSLQHTAQRIADCYTGKLRGTACEAVAPRGDKEILKNYFDPESKAIRTGALGMVLIEIDSGRVVATGNALSECSTSALNRPAPQKEGAVQATIAGQLCPTLPDQKMQWLLSLPPMLWPVPPGSTGKVLPIASALDEGSIAPSKDDYWKSILAASEEGSGIQAMALKHAKRLQKLYAQFGLDQGRQDILFANANTTFPVPEWWVQHSTGLKDVTIPSMDYATAQRIYQDKLAGINVDARYGVPQVREYLRARVFMDTALGGGDLRTSTLGMAQTMRLLALHAKGAQQAPQTHLAETTGVRPDKLQLGALPSGAAQRTLGLLSGITASAWHGTAQGSCRRAFGQCDKEGLPDLVGKTGTADLYINEDSEILKPGMEFPTKSFMAVFQAQGRQYAVAATALRAPQGPKMHLELKSNPAAEAVLTLVRQMRAGQGSDNATQGKR